MGLASVGFLLILFTWIGLAGDWTFLFAIPICLFIGYFLSSYAIANWRANREFVFRISDTTIEQAVPVKNCGDSFVIPLNRVRQVLYVRDEHSDSSNRHMTIVDLDGAQFKVTPNYINPLDGVARALKSLGVPVLLERPANQTSAPLIGSKTS